MTPTTDPLRDWFDDHGLGECAMRWYDSLPAADCTAERVWALCDRGDWLLWWHERAGTPASVLAPVAYRAADRACREYAPAALQAAGLTTEAEALRNLPQIVDRESARAARAAAEDAEDAARTAWTAARVAWTAAGAAWTAVDAANAAETAARAAEAAAAAAGDAGDAAWAARAAELRQSAEDCRELLGPPGQLGSRRGGWRCACSTSLRGRR